MSNNMLEVVSRELPIGYLQDGKFVTDCDIVPMTGLVKKTLARPEIRQNPVTVTDTLLMSCVRRVGTIGGDNNQIKKSVFQKMFLGDRDFLTLEIRKLTKGNIVTAEMTCDSCKNKLDIKIDLAEVKTKKLGAHRIDNGMVLLDIASEDPKFSAVLRLPTGEDQSAVSGIMVRNPIEANYKLYMRCLREWNGETVEKISPTLFDDLLDSVIDEFERQFMEVQPGPDLRQETGCPLCGASLIASMEVSDFLYRLPGKEKT